MNIIKAMLVNLIGYYKLPVVVMVVVVEINT